jgi:signal peptidase II
MHASPSKLMSAPPDALQETEAPPAPPAAGRPSYPLFFLVAAATAGFDLATKAWATHALGADDSPSHIGLIKDHLNFVLSHNSGAAWGLLHDAPKYVRLPFFIGVSAAAIVFVTVIYRRAGPDQRALRWGLPLVLGGALGNLVDRVRFAHVVDFIQVFASWGGREHYWPTFNVADIAICVGVGLMLLDALKQGRKPAPAQS